MSQALATQTPAALPAADDCTLMPRSAQVPQQTFSSPVTPMKRKASPPAANDCTRSARLAQVPQQTFSLSLTPMKRKASSSELGVPFSGCKKGDTKINKPAHRVTRLSEKDPTYKKFGVDTHATIAIARDGDCFFNCLRKAFSLTGLDIRERLAKYTSIADETDDCLIMRSICADHLTSDLFDNYKLLSEEDSEEYGFMKKGKINNLQKLQQEMRKPGKIWAREGDLDHLARILNITILLYDEHFDSKIRFPRDMSQGEYYIVIKRDKQGIHYSLIKFPWSSETNTVCVVKQKKAQEWICLFTPYEIPRDILAFFPTSL